MATNRGKDFEKQVRLGFEKVPDTFVYRLQDSMGGYSGVANICDFIVYKEPTLYCIECKSCHNNVWYFSNLTDNQYKGMLNAVQTNGVKAGIILWFVDHDTTVYIPIETIKEYKDCGLKGVSYKTLDDSLLVIDGKKKRVFFDYDMTNFFN